MRFCAIASIKSITKNMAEDMLSFYHGDEPGHIPGLLPDPYYCMYLYLASFIVDSCANFL